MPFITKLGSVAARAYGWLASVAQAVVSSDTYFYLVSMLLPGNGTNGAQNNTFLDSSTNNFTITRNGNTTQGTFSPFSQTGWSNYFDGTGDTLSAPASAAFAFGTGDFTVEAWVYQIGVTSYRLATNRNPVGAVAGTWSFTISASGTQIAFSEVVAGEPGPLVTIASILNKWTHVAACRQSGTTRIFVNGVLVGSASQTTNFSSTAYSLVIGSTPTDFLNGYISNLRIVKGTALYTTFFAPPIAPLTAITNTSLLTCRSNALVDNSANRFAITRGGDTSVTANSPFAPNNFTPASYSGYFDGTGDYLSTTYGGGIASSQAFTFEFWIYPNGSIPVNTGIDTTQVVGGFLLYGGSTANTFVISRNSVAAIFTSTLAVTSNAWNHVAIARNTAGNLRMWINGANAGTITDSGAFTAASIKYIASQGAANYFTGLLSNYRWVVGTAVYDPTQTTITVPTAPLTAITNTSLLTLQNATFIDNSTNAFAITVNGNSQPVTTNPFQTPSPTSVPVSSTAYSGYFDGTGDYLSIPDNTALDVEASDFTIECFIYLFGTPATKFVFAKRSTGLVVGGVNVVFASTLAPALYATVNNSTWALSQTSSVSCTLGWNHLAAVRNGTNWRLYVNGVVGVDATLSGTVPNNTDAFTIAAGGANGADTINALISNFRVVKGTAVYTAAFIPPTSPLTAITNTSLLTCQNSTFIDNSTNAFAITVAGNTVTTPVSPFAPNNQTPISYSGSFDGSGDYLSTPTGAMPTSGDFCIECWFWVQNALVYAIPGGQYVSRLVSGIGTNACEFQVKGAGTSTVPTQLAVASYGSANFAMEATGLTISVNAWNHVAAVRNGSNCAIFLNGTRVTNTVTGTSTYSFAASGARIGGAGDAATGYLSYLKGFISNARTVLGNSVYSPTSTSITVPTAPLTAIPNTALLTCQNATFIDNSTNAFAITANGNAQPVADNPFGFTTTQPVAWSATTNGGSGYFDGSGDYLSAANNAAFDLGTGAFTIEAWVYISGNSTADAGGMRLAAIFGAFPSSGSATGYNFVIDGNASTTGTGVIFNNFVSGTQFQISATATVSQNTWNHIAAVRSGTVTTIYLNGVSIGSGTLANQNVNTGGNSIKIGALAYAGYPTELIGYISNFRVVKGTALYTSNFTPPLLPFTAVTNTSLLLNYTNAGIYDAASQIELETIGDAQISTAQSKWGGGSMAFDGTGDYLLPAPTPRTTGVLPLTLGTGDFTIEFWVYFAAGSTATRFLLDWRPASTEGVYPMIYTTAASAIAFYVSSLNRIVGGTVSATTWTHIALCRSGSSTRLFLNGVQTGSTYTDTNNYLGPANRPVIGASGLSLGGSALNGYIDDLRITKFARYTANFTPPTAAFPTQ